MSTDQKKIYSDMLGMLKKLGLKTTDTVKESVNKYMTDSKRDAEEHTVTGHSLHHDPVARKLRVKKLMGG